ncbi:hypothetical protein HK405_002784 [Cladochytrium tenue]|nr:hypothetical protein HK405_002784 [Cladochytrium tenue]
MKHVPDYLMPKGRAAAIAATGTGGTVFVPFRLDTRRRRGTGVVKRGWRGAGGVGHGPGANAAAAARKRSDPLKSLRIRRPGAAFAAAVIIVLAATILAAGGPVNAATSSTSSTSLLSSSSSKTTAAAATSSSTTSTSTTSSTLAGTTTTSNSVSSTTSSGTAAAASSSFTFVALPKYVRALDGSLNGNANVTSTVVPTSSPYYNYVSGGSSSSSWFTGWTKIGVIAGSVVGGLVLLMLGSYIYSKRTDAKEKALKSDEIAYSAPPPRKKRDEMLQHLNSDSPDRLLEQRHSPHSASSMRAPATAVTSQGSYPSAGAYMPAPQYGYPSSNGYTAAPNVYPTNPYAASQY